VNYFSLTGKLRLIIVYFLFMAEGLRQLSITDAAEGLRIVNGEFAKSTLCDANGNKSAVGKLLMLLGVYDRDMVEMSMEDAHQILKGNIHGILDIQIPLLCYVNDHTPGKFPLDVVTGRLVDVLVRPERFLGSHTQEILVLDRLLHTYTDEQRLEIAEVDWDSWEVRAADSAAQVSSSKACEIEAGDFFAANGSLGTRMFNERSAAVLDAWDFYSPAVANFGYRRIHTNHSAWWIARFVARESGRGFDEDLRRIYREVVNELQGWEIYQTYKPNKENPKQPIHEPFFTGMLPDLEGNPLTLETLSRYARK
jgi:hypothetical protein